MKLGGYFGLTAPMFLLYYDDLSEASFKYGLSILDYPINSDFLKFFKTELYYLSRTLDALEVTYVSVNKGASFSDMDGSKSRSLVNGKVSDDNQNNEYTYALYNEITDIVILKIVKGIKDGVSKYDLSFVDINDKQKTVMNFNALLKSFMVMSEPMINPKRLALTFLSTLVKESYVENGSSADITRFLLDAFSFEECLPRRFKCGKDVVNLNEDEYNLLTEFYSKRELLSDLIDKISITQKEEDYVFDTSFSNLMGRRPTSMFYLIAKKFEYTKNKNSTFLRNIISEVKSDLRRFKKIFSEKVSTTVIDDTLLTRNELWDIIATYERDKADFFTRLIRDGSIDYSYLIKSDVELLSDLYDMVIKMNLDEFNKKFYCSFTKSSFKELITKFNKIGICGLNLSSLELFKESVKCVSLLPSDKIIKTEEEHQEFVNVVSDIECLVDTLIPIGVKINV